MPNNFAIYCLPRSGSQHLTHLLDSDPQIICHGEIFQPKGLKVKKTHRDRMTITDQRGRDADPIGFAEQLRSLDPDLHFGFKMLRRHVEVLPKLKRFLMSSDWRTIILVRDPIETYASTVRASETGVWGQPKAKREKPDTANMPVHSTPEALERFASGYNSFVELCQNIREKKPETFVIDHAQLNDAGALKALLKFIGVTNPDTSMLKSGLEKQYSGKISEAFDNWAELKASLDAAWPFATPLALSYQAKSGARSKATAAQG